MFSVILLITIVKTGKQSNRSARKNCEQQQQLCIVLVLTGTILAICLAFFIRSTADPLAEQQCLWTAFNNSFVLWDLTIFSHVLRGKRLISWRFLPIFGSCLDHLYRFVFNHKNCIRPTLVAYIQKRYRSVILLSSSHLTPSIDESTGDSRKPVMVTDYNHTKGGVDLMDECVETFTCRRKTTRRPLLLYYNLLDVAVNKVFISAHEKVGRGDRADFIRALSMQMATPSRLQQSRVSSNSKRCIRDLLHLSSIPLGSSSPSRNPGHCHLCRKSSRSSATPVSCVAAIKTHTQVEKLICYNKLFVKKVTVFSVWYSLIESFFF